MDEENPTPSDEALEAAVSFVKECKMGKVERGGWICLLEVESPFEETWVQYLGYSPDPSEAGKIDARRDALVGLATDMETWPWDTLTTN